MEDENIAVADCEQGPINSTAASFEKDLTQFEIDVFVLGSQRARAGILFQARQGFVERSGSGDRSRLRTLNEEVENVLVIAFGVPKRLDPEFHSSIISPRLA